METDIILRQINRKLIIIERLINYENYLDAHKLIFQCILNTNRIRGNITLNRLNTIKNSLEELTNICTVNINNSANNSYVPELRIEGRGRPSILITKQQLEMFISENYTAAKIAVHFKCSKSLIYKRCYEEGLKFRNKYCNINDDDLMEEIRNIHSEFPNSGAGMMDGYLKTKGIHVQRARIRTLLAAVDPVGTALRWSKAIKRRSYSVPTPNSLWHMDAHLKLVRWGFVTHGCIDGYSRLITYLKCTTSITAQTVINIFTPALVKYGVPSRVRSDHGYENYFAAILMNILRGLDRSSHITGKSVHNQRIERLWKDVFEQVIHTFYVEFYALEAEGLLDPNNNTHRFVLQSVYLNDINRRLNIFLDGWNKHKIRTEGYRSPRQIWLDGMLHNINSNHTSTEEVFREQPELFERVSGLLNNLGVDLENETIDVPENYSQLTAVLILNEHQQQSFKIILESSINAKDKFLAGLELIL